MLATLRDRYVDGLTAYRHESATGSAEASAAVNTWLGTFMDAAVIAVEQSQQLVDRIQGLRVDWTTRLAAHRTATGLRAAPRADSAAARLLELLPGAPVLTATTLAHILGVSFPAASLALDELRQAGILTTKSIERGATAFIARQVLDLVALTEQQLASTQFDTRATAPNRPAPARPNR